MIRNQAERLASGLVNLNLVDSDSHDVYTYGFELLISVLINTVVMAIISIAFCRYYDWLLFLAAFIPLRTTAGGYHASSHFKCIAVGSIGFTALIIVSRFQISWSIIILLTTVLSLIVVLLFSPVEARNKPLSEEYKKKNRSRSIFIGCINLLISVVSLIIPGLYNVLRMYFSGVFAATISMVVAKIIILIKSGKKNESFT